ncbi:DUF4132 domain-containing protein [Pseudomonas paralcaligenes]|uniref:DUF4132 domain-containing protein n=1 Tax=Pseudomonas paralcaligenes TaxID=2772558 RepID=UPI001C818E9F|nr:DUF4132 domain-containing protein [Pseudomonas paralcaligenes]
MTDDIDFIHHLAQAKDEADFLQRLASAYQRHSIGTGLDFAGVERYWRAQADLPDEWRRALAQNAYLHNQGASNFYIGDRVKAFYGWALADRPAEAWLDRWERVILLFSPFASSGSLGRTWLPSASGAGQRAWERVAGTLMKAWARDIATGEGGWLAVHQWLLAAQADPACLSDALVEWQELPLFVVERLIGLRLFMTIIREQLQLDEVTPERWIDLLLVNAGSISRSPDDTDFPYGVARNVRHQFHLPLLKLLVESPRLREILGADSARDFPASEIFGDLNLAVLVAEPLDGFRRLLEGTSKEVLAGLWGNGEFHARCPEAALMFHQRKFELGAGFSTDLNSPKALEWYGEVIAKIPSDSRDFAEILEKLADHLDEAALHDLIVRVLANDPQARPCFRLLDKVADVDRLRSYLKSPNASLPGMAAVRLLELATVLRNADDEDGWGRDAWVPEPGNWEVLTQVSRDYPALFIDCLDAGDLWRGRDRIERWTLLWSAAGDADDRLKIIEKCFAYDGLGSDTEHAGLMAFVETLFDEAPQLFHRYVEEAYDDSLKRVVVVLGGHQTPLLQLLPSMAGRFLTLGSRPRPAVVQAVRRALLAHPSAFADLDEKAQITLLPLFDDACLEACADALSRVFASNSKTLRVPAVSLVARCAPQVLLRSGLLDAAPKARKPVLIGMALSPDPAMAEPIAQHIADKAHDEYSRSVSLDALERAGYPLQGLDPWAGIDLAGLQAQARGAKVPSAVGKCWNDAFASLLAPLGEPLGQFLLAILAEGGEVLPRRARQILAFLPAGRRSDLALLGVEQWIAADGATAQDWLLLPLEPYGDERAANALVKAVKDWKKVRKQKASAAIRLLCRLPGNYGVSQVRELWESGKFSDSIMQNARLALTEVAQKQDMTLEEFLEQLVPDFGLQRDGLKLDVGPTVYTVRIRPDLSLAVLDEKGKAGKSLPKAKAGEDPDKRSLAENQYKALTKNLKPVLKQQARRLTRALQLGTSWPAETWRRLFAEHPLMACIAQGVVWAAESADGQPLARFRPDDTGALIDLQDRDFALADGARVHIAHPLELEEDERAAWVQHFADYALVSPIGQWEIVVVRPSAEELQASELARAKGACLSRGKLGSLLERWGYLKGEAGDGAMVNEHYWSLDGERWLMSLDHSGISVFFDPDEEVEVGTFTVSKREEEGYVRQRMEDLPPALLNTLLAQAETLLQLESA